MPTASKISRVFLAQQAVSPLGIHLQGISGNQNDGYINRMSCSLLRATWRPALFWGRRWPIRRPEHIGTIRRHKQEHYGVLSESPLWCSSRQDSTISRMQQVHVSPAMTRTTRFFGWTTNGLDEYSHLSFLRKQESIFLIVGENSC